MLETEALSLVFYENEFPHEFFPAAVYSTLDRMGCLRPSCPTFLQYMHNSTKFWLVKHWLPVLIELWILWLFAFLLRFFVSFEPDFNLVARISFPFLRSLERSSSSRSFPWNELMFFEKVLARSTVNYFSVWNSLQMTQPFSISLSGSSIVSLCLNLKYIESIAIGETDCKFIC